MIRSTTRRKMFGEWRLWGVLGVLCAASCGVQAAPQPARIIFDTDMGNDIDDALALSMLHSFEARGEAKLLAVTITKDNQWAAPYVDLVNTFYGRGNLSIGVVRNGVTREDSPYIRVPSERKRADGTPLHRHDLRDGKAAPDAVDVLRRVLAGEQDNAVTMVQVGFSTNLARLLDSPPDRHSPLNGTELVRRKVRLLSAMAGAFPTGDREYNVHMDLKSAQRLFAQWPTPIVASGFEIGLAILYPASSIEKHFAYVPEHPVAEAYRLYQKMPYNRPTWDLTSVLYAVRPDENYFDLSAPGKISAKDDGHTQFEANANGTHRYLIATPAQRPRILEALVNLASQPPAALPAGLTATAGAVRR
ncbi:MAG: hypothetical protein JWN98_1499 [Abditibacteriota bacterium]|nr:hypothetical protein [Abditibacteriota bacterium]